MLCNSKCKHTKKIFKKNLSLISVMSLNMNLEIFLDPEFFIAFFALKVEHVRVNSLKKEEKKN